MGIDDRMKKMPKNFGSQGNSGNRNFNSGSRQFNNGGYRNDNRSYGRAPQLTKIRGVDPAPIGSPFYNPYTFIPFPKSVDRGDVSYLTADEREQDRFTGVLNLKVLALSPIMSCEVSPYATENDHKKYHALTVGSDGIVPATSVRGSLRTLMTILDGGTLGYMDTRIWLCHGRDLPVGPTMKEKDIPAFLAKVEQPGGYGKKGKLRLGETWLISVDRKLNKLGPFRYLDKLRPTTGAKEMFIDDPENPTSYSESYSDKFCYEVKLSGRPVNNKGKREGVFKAGSTVIDVPAHIWETYNGRNRNGVRKELRAGDLVWIEPKNPRMAPRTAEDIESIQWARWGREGQQLQNALPNCVLPDSLRDDGRVDMVTDLWGQVPMGDNRDGAFASRIRPHNLVFKNAAIDKNVALAPLAQPHPGCLPFYRQASATSISTASELNGYKVYRNTSARGAQSPWLFSVQGIFDKDDVNKMQSCSQKMNKTVDLLSQDQVGDLKISLRSLSKKELALLLLACSVDWKLGGGKPLGLGHCRVIGAELLNEFSEKILDLNGNEGISLPSEYAALVEHLQKRVDLYKKSQEPVELLRYPRAVSDNKGGLRREGLGWFARHATVAKQKTELETTKVGDAYYNGMVLGNMESNPGPLFGYDLIGVDVEKERGNKLCFGALEPYDPNKHKPHGNRFENNSQSAKTRRDDRKQRSW